MDNFVHLEVQSAFSFLWGTFSPEELVQHVVALGQKTVALTDDSLHGVVRFYKAATASGIQPIVGAKLSLWDGSPVTLLASNFEGYGNLCRLLSVALGNGASPHNLVTRQDMAHRSKGLICLAGGRGSLIRSSLEKGRIEAARISLLAIREVLHNPERLFVVLQNHDESSDMNSEAFRVMERTVDLAEGLSLPIVASNMVTFLRPEDYVLHRTLTGIQREHHHKNIYPLPNDRFFLASGEEMQRRIPYPQAIENTAHIASLCRSFSLPVGRLHPPSLQPRGEASEKARQTLFHGRGSISPAVSRALHPKTRQGIDCNKSASIG